jgi:ribosomal protein L7/L12
MTRGPERRRIWPLVTLAFAPLMAASAAGSDDPASLVFVQKAVAAINRGDQEARRALLHPGALKCDEALRRAKIEGAYAPSQRPIPSGYRWELRPLPAGMAGWFPDKFDYPVHPTHQLNIDFDSGPHRGGGVVLQVVRYRGEWREVTGCPKASTLVEARQAAKARGQQEERIRHLAAGIAPRLRAEVLQRVADGRKVDAILHYRKATNEDLTIAKGVVERLIQESEARGAKK